MIALALTGIVVAGILYWRGTRLERGSRSQRERPRRGQAFYAGLVALAVAIAPPLDGLADKLFWAHMVQHGLLQMLAPPLIVLGAPWLVIMRPFSLGGRRRATRWLVRSRTAAPLRAGARFLTVPALAAFLFLGTIWLSHLPAVFDYVAARPLLHETEHLGFFALGLLFWSRALDSPPFRARLTRWRRLGFFVVGAIAEAALAILILGAGSPLYTTYEQVRPRPEHLTVLQDQQLGGAIMLEPAGLPLLFAILWSIGTLIGPKARRRGASAPLPAAVPTPDRYPTERALKSGSAK
jgi:cytochrome c oxidase assembly factor CtaG